jgi:hypothetical protein
MKKSHKLTFMYFSKTGQLEEIQTKATALNKRDIM